VPGGPSEIPDAKLSPTPVFFSGAERPSSRRPWPAPTFGGPHVHRSFPLRKRRIDARMRPVRPSLKRTGLRRRHDGVHGPTRLMPVVCSNSGYLVFGRSSGGRSSRPIGDDAETARHSPRDRGRRKLRAPSGGCGAACRACNLGPSGIRPQRRRPSARLIKETDVIEPAFRTRR